MKAIVTGGAGLIGSHLVEELLAEQFEVHIIDNLISGKHKHVTFL
ncbi:NAD-dependent epimerase/dehydratase family protein [Paenibacillus alginolyticus]|nr:NAD-dependent epimerase/dehydratase family protein [Paenibacillus alginolyticus]